MRPLSLSFIPLIALTSSLGCGTVTSYAELNPSPVPMTPRDPATVEVFTAAKPERPYVEVGIVEAQQESRHSLDEMPDIISKMRARAAAQGCDAMIINSNNDAVVGGTTDGSGSTGTLEGFRGACIMYKPVAATPSPAPAAPAPPPAPVASEAADSGGQ